MQFEPPTEHYDERIRAIDEELCHLIQQRKALSNNNPGFPPQEFIADWAEKYGLYEDFLNVLFSHFLYEESYRAAVEPKGFIKNIPVLKTTEKDNRMYTVTFLRQYQNASVVQLLVDVEIFDREATVHSHPNFLELSIEDDETAYDCRNDGGGGSDGHMSYNFVVSPPLPEDLSGIKLVFKEYQTPTKTKPTGLEISF